MKKFMLITVVLLVFVSLLTGCSSTTPKCEHDYRSTILKKATYDSEGIMKYVCKKCGNTYTDAIEKLERHMLPTSILDDALSNIKFTRGPFSISIGKLVNKAIDGYKIQYLTCEEAIDQGYLSKSQIGDSVDINNVFYVIISGDIMLNPEIPYMTEYKEEAVYGWMLFDENNRLKNSSIEVCDELAYSAVIIMSNGY